MIVDIEPYIIGKEETVREALRKINKLGVNNAVLFVVDALGIMEGTVTDGDIRRGLINDVKLENTIEHVVNKNFYSIKRNAFDFDYIKEAKSKGIFILPNLSDEGRILGISNLENFKVSLPLHAVIMAGGKGERLLPLTKDTPKPMLKVGDTPILEHNINRLISYGIKHIHISINYLGNIIQEYFGDGSSKGINIEYIKEDKPLGTFGSMSMISEFSYDNVLLMNSDILTNIDFEDMYNNYKNSAASMCAASIPYNVKVPYGIMQTNDKDEVTGLVEKPTYTHYANAGIYMLNKKLLSGIPENTFYNTTDLMQELINNSKGLIHYPIRSYWLDIGKYEDFARAQQDFKHINF